MATKHNFDENQSKIIDSVIRSLGTRGEYARKKNTLREEMAAWPEFSDGDFSNQLVTVGKSLPKGPLKSDFATSLRGHLKRQQTVHKPEGKSAVVKAIGTQNRYSEVPGRSKTVPKSNLTVSMPSMDDLFEMQRFNKKPELVSYRSDLLQRKDLYTGKDREPLILYKGFQSLAKREQFMGIGPNGNLHIPGRGVFGDGSYAVSRGLDPNQSGSDSQALEIAKSYTGSKDLKAQRNLVLAMGIRNSGNVLEFSSPSKFWKWAIRAQEVVKSKLNYLSEDPGEIAAALGYHAYGVNMENGEIEWVILNRGCLVVAVDASK